MQMKLLAGQPAMPPGSLTGLGPLPDLSNTNELYFNGSGDDKSNLWVSVGGNQGVIRACSFLEALGEMISFPFLVFRSSPHSLVHGPLPLLKPAIYLSVFLQLHQPLDSPVSL